MAKKRKRAKPKSYREKCERIVSIRKTRFMMNRLSRLVTIFSALLVVSVTLWFYNTGGVALIESWVSGAFASAASSVGFKVEMVRVSGIQNANEEEITQSLDIPAGSPIFGVSLEKAREELKRRSWIKDASVKRLLPSVISVAVVERKPAALWQNKKKLYLIDEEGFQIEQAAQSSWQRLPLVIGEGANTEIRPLFALLETNPEIAAKVKSATRVGGRRWNLRLGNGIEVRLPEKSPEAALAILSDLQKNKRILEKSINAIDLRIPEKVFIGLPGADAEKQKSKGSV